MCRISDIPDEEILDAIRQRPTTGKTPDEALSQKYPFRVILRKMEQMYKRGLLDFGVSLRTAWIKPSSLTDATAEPPPPIDRPPYPRPNQQWNSGGPTDARHRRTRKDRLP